MKRLIGVLLVACALPSAAFAQDRAVTAQPKAVAAKCLFVDATVPITTSGYWCLRGNVVGRGIVIDASDVTLDLKGYSIINDGTATQPVEFSGNLVGVLSSNRDNITVRNGIIRGFDYGLHLGFPAGVRGNLTVEKLFVQGSKKRGISVLGYDAINILDNVITGTGPVDATGMYVMGRDDPYNNYVNNSLLVIMGNRVHDTHVTAAGQFGWWHTRGISAIDGAHTIIENNTITETYNEAPGTGLRAQGINLGNRFPYTSRIANNTIVNTQAAGNSQGIALSQSMGVPAYTGPMDYFGLVTGNRVQNFNRAVLSTSAISVNGKPVGVTVFTYSSNVAAQISGQAFYGGNMLGNTNRIE